MITFDIKAPDTNILPAIIDKIDNLNKPKGSLGRLESLAKQICLVQQTLNPVLKHPCHILLGGDHGIEHERVSVSPREVTWQQLVNFTQGGGGVNMFCRQHGFDLTIIDMGVDHDFHGHPGIRDFKISYGTRNFRYEAAMDEQEYAKAIATGALLADEMHSRGSNVLCIGEMGIANTSPSSIWMSIWGGLPLEDCIGAGAGLQSSGIEHKKDVLREALNRFNTSYPNADTNTVIRYFGGFEMVGAIGAMLRGAELGMLVLVDGFIMTACMLAASRLHPNVLHYAIFGHCGDESGHARMLSLMNAEPLLHLGMRLGEGTGALCSYPIIESAVRMVNEMNNFKDAQITKYF